MKWYYRFAGIVNPAFLLVIRLTTLMTRARLRVLVYNPEGKILLVKSVFGMKEWELPGGAAGFRESDKAAAARELYEETAIEVETTHLRKRISRQNPFPMIIFETQLNQDKQAQIIRPFEMRQVGWFLPNALPEDAAEYVRQIV